MGNEYFNKRIEYLNSEEGKQELDEFLLQDSLKNERRQRWYTKFHNLSVSDRAYIIENRIKKYESNEYLERQRKLGNYDTDKPFYDFLYNYAKEYGICISVEKYGDYNYKFDNYIISIFIGQGSYYILYKL